MESRFFKPSRKKDWCDKMRIGLQCSTEVEAWFKLLSLVEKNQGFQKLEFILDMMNSSDPLSHKNRYD